MELTDLKHAINTGAIKEGNSLNNSESSSRTLKYKQIKNESSNDELPKFANGLPGPGVINTSGITPNAYSVTTYGTNTVGEYFNSPAALKGAENIHAPIVGSNIKTASKGSGVNVGNIGNVVTSGVQFAGDAINSFSVNETGEEIANRQGASDLSIGGVGYNSPNMINLNDEMERVKKENAGNTLKTVGSGAALGAAAGSIIPGLGTIAGGLIGGAVGLLTGIFGGESRKRRYREMLAKQNAMISAVQDSARGSAHTKALQISNAREYGNSESQYLYGAEDGKVSTTSITPDTYFQTYYAPEIKEYNKNKLTYSALGPVNAEPNAKVSKGEIIANKLLGTMYRVPGGKDNKDTEDAYLIDSDTVVTNKGGESDRAFATGDIRQSEINMMNRNKKRGLMMAKNGKLPKYKEGWLGNAITSGIGALGGLSQWWEAKNSTPRKTDSYRSNPYEGVSLDILSRLGISPFPTMQQLRNAEARTNRAIDMSGGLNAGQRTLTRLAALNNTQRAIADALQNIQMQNNNYFSDYAKTALAAGAANAQRAMQANMYDEEMYAKAHAARQQGMQMGMRNIIDQHNNFWANEFKRGQLNDAMDLYRQDLKLKKDELNALLNNKNSTNTTNSSPMNNYFINKASKNERRLKNPFAYYGTPSYHDLTGQWLTTYPNMYQIPNIPKIDVRTGKYI